MTEIDLTPITRLEYDIDAILNDHAVAEPITRIELILADIVAGNTTTVVPVTRIETYLAIISGADYPVPEPVTRIETFLAIIAGEDYEEPEAVTRLEGLLAEWVEKGSGIWKTVTGALIHITDALASPVQALSVAIEPYQSGSGDPSPTNIRPITGATGCNINCAGANLYDNTYEKTGYLQVNGGRKTSSSWAITYYIEVSTGNYVAKGLSVSGSGTYICVYDSEQTFIRSIEITANEPVYFSIANGEKYIRMSVRIGSSEYETAQLLKYDIHTISWQTEAGTVYCGTLDAVNGELTSTKGKIVLNGNETETWSAINGAFYAEVLPEGYALDSQDDWICNKYKPATKIPKSAQIADRNNLTIFNQNKYERRVFIKDTSITTVADLQASLASDPVEIVFTLPTSSEHTVTPVSVSTLAGENNIWADVNGEITLIYKAQSS